MSSATAHLIFAEPFDPEVLDLARAAGRVSSLAECSEQALLSAIPDCDALIVRTKSRVTARVIDAARRLRVIGRAGVGLENIDLEAARRRGIKVVYTPYAATEAVADLTVAMILALTRRLPHYDSMVRTGRFDAARGLILPELRDLTLGIVGLGRIGRAVARRCHLGFGMRVVYNDLAAVPEPGFPAAFLEKPALYREADVVSLHVPLTDLTQGLIGVAALSEFRPAAILINTSRGKVVDSVALADALREGRIGGAGIDVFDEEPPPPNHPLRSAPNVLLTPHVGARTTHGLRNMNRIVEDVIRVLRGEPPHHQA